MKVLRYLFCLCVAGKLFAGDVKGDIPLDFVEYFDVGKWETVKFLDAPKGEINVDGVNNYLYMFFQDMWSQGLGAANFCNGQVHDLSKMTREDYATMSITNSFHTLYKNTKGKQINKQSVFSYMVGQLIYMGDMRLGVTFGGKYATSKDWDFGFDTNDPVVLAKEVACWANKLKLARLDFDVRHKAFAKNDPEKLAYFFITVKANFKGVVTLTVPGDTSLWGLTGKYLSPLFKEEAFKNMFDNLNLILFDKKQYYLNAGQVPTQSWDLYTWLTQLVENSGYTYTEAALLLNIGLNAKVDYLSVKSSVGPLPYDKMPAGITNGNATKVIFDALVASLTKLTKEDVLLGNPFYMDDNADYAVSSSNDYASQFFNNTGNLEMDFKRYP